MTEKQKLEPTINKKLTTGQQKTSKKHVTSMSWHLSPRCGLVTLVSGYPVLTPVYYQVKHRLQA